MKTDYLEKHTNKPCSQNKTTSVVITEKVNNSKLTFNKGFISFPNECSELGTSWLDTRQLSWLALGSGL